MCIWGKEEGRKVIVYGRLGVQEREKVVGWERRGGCERKGVSEIVCVLLLLLRQRWLFLPLTSRGSLSEIAPTRHSRCH